MSAWSGFGDYVEKLGAPMTGQGDAANFEAMLEKALAAEAAAPALGATDVRSRGPFDQLDLPLKCESCCFKNHLFLL